MDIYEAKVVTGAQNLLDWYKCNRNNVDLFSYLDRVVNTNDVAIWFVYSSDIREYLEKDKCFLSFDEFENYIKNIVDGKMETRLEKNNNLLNKALLNHVLVPAAKYVVRNYM